MQERNKLKFEVHLVEHCNLNCKGCFHFSNIAEPEFLDINEYKKDVRRLSLLYKADMSLVLLMGGEPLLHRDINKFMIETRRAFPNGKIGLVTNAILLPEMDDSFWEICRSCNITLMPTVYPISVNFDMIEKKAAEYSVDIDYFNDKKTEKTLSVLSIDDNGEQDINANFYECYRSNFCITLEHGYLYTCIMPAHIRHYTKKFRLDFGDFHSDGINIYKAETSGEIDEFLKQPIRACSYCNRSKWRSGLNWERTQKNIEEWK